MSAEILYPADVNERDGAVLLVLHLGGERRQAAGRLLVDRAQGDG